MEFSKREYWSLFPSPGDLPNSGVEPRSPMLQVDSLPAKPQGKPKNTGVGRLSLFQWIFLTQVLYQLSYQGSPSLKKAILQFPGLSLEFCVLILSQAARKEKGVVRCKRNKQKSLGPS